MDEAPMQRVNIWELSCRLARLILPISMARLGKFLKFKALVSLGLPRELLIDETSFHQREDNDRTVKLSTGKF